MPVEERVASLRAQNLTVPGSLLSDFETQRKATPAEVRSMYLSVLGREPDPEGFSYYTSQPIENLRQSFYQASLPEMEKRVGAIDVTTTIPTPVIGQRSEPTAQELYLGLGRAPDPAGLAFYENYSGPNREAAFATGAAEKGEQYDPTKPLAITLPGQTTTTSLSGMTPQQRDLSRLMVSKMPTTPTTTAPSVFSPENVAAQLELERLRLQPTPEPPAETPVAGFAQGGLVNDDINRMLQNQRNAVMRESQSRRMLTNLGAPPVKKFSDGGPAGSSSSGVRRLKMSGYQAGGDVTDEMFTGTRPEDFPETSSVDKKAGELLRALSEGTRGFVGAEPIEAGSEAYRTGQALANMPAVGVVAATAKGAGKAKDALKSIVDPARLFEEVEKIPRNQVIDDLRSAHIGGVGDFGDSDAKYYFSQIPGGKEYIKKSQQVAKKNLGDRFMGYRLMSKDQFEDLQAGDVGDLLSFTLDQNTAEALRNFVTNQKRTDLVVAEVPLTPKHIVAFGHPGEKEIIVDTGVGWSIDEFKQASPLKKAKGGEVTNDEFIQEMMTGTRPTDQGTNPGILPPEIRKPIDVGLDLANTALRGTAAAVAGPVYGLYKGVTGGQYGTPEGVRVGEQAATNLMSTITGEPKTQEARDIMNFVGEKVEQAKIPMMPQFLTMPLPAPGSARAAMRALDMDKPPTGAVTLAAPPTPSLDSLGMSSRLSEAVDRLQARGTGEQLLAQLNKAQGVPQAEIKATGLDEFLKSAGKVTRDDIQGYLEKNRVNLVEDERSFAGAPIDSKVKHNQLTLPGGDNYREVLFKLPQKEGQPSFIPPASHYEDAANTFGSIRMTDRVVDGKPILFAEEVQSDWAIKAAKEGYDEPEKAARRNQQLSEARQALAQAEARAEAAKKAFQNRGPQDESLQLLGNMEFAQQNAEKVRRFIQALEIKATPENPFKNNWYQPVMNRFLIKAAQEGKAGIGLTNGEVHIQRYNLRNYTDKVIYNPKTKLFAIFDRATDDVAKNIYQNIDEPKLRRMIGDETAEKLLNSGSKTDSAMGDDIFVLSGNQLEIGGGGKNTFYDKILPDYLNKLGKKYGVKVETRMLPAFSDQQKSTVNPLGRISDEKAREIYYLPLTEEMRNDLLGKGLPTFKEGGEVTNDEFIQQVMTGTPMSDTSTRPGILPPELREAIDVPLDFANLLIRGTAAVPIGGFAGLYKGLTGGKYGTQEGVKEADTEAARMMAEITGEPKTQTAKDVLQSIGDKMQEYKLDAAVPQLLTLPSPGAGTTEFIKQAVRSEFEAPPVGAVDIGALMPKPKKGVELSEQEVGKLVDSSQVSDEQAPALVETARRVKEIFNTNQGWEPMELIRAKIKPGKEDNLAVDLEAQKIPYNFHIVPEGMAKPAWEKKISNGIVGEVRKVVERAKAGDQKALDILGQASWYRSMRKRLRTEFGSIGDVFADVLGTTSAQTGVEQNFNNAIEILRRYSRGEYDKELKAYEDRLKSGESMDGTELTQLHKKGEFPLITKASGALFNANSPSSMGALLDMFRSVRTGDSPKTPNFTGNLIGLTNEATVDVWAARLLRRLSGKKRIPPMAEKGVSGKHLVGSTLYEPKVGGEFGFGQKVFKDAANRINKTGVIKNFDPKIGDVGPDDLQAIAWFIEKERWTDNGWTSKAGEGGSLEYEMSFAGAPNQAMVNDLRREINKGFKEPPQRKKESDQDHALRVEAARQAYDGNRQNLINQLSLLKKDVDRYQIGLSGERPGKPLASGYQRAELAAGVDDVVRDDQNVIAYNLTNSYGSFMSEVERALNGEFVVRGNFDPIPLERRVVELGKEYDQDAVFLSKVLPDGQSANARPGIEIYFKEKVSPEQMAKVTERLRNYGVDGFTYVTDMRFSDRPGMQVRAGSPETAELTGLRFQYVPEFDDAYSPETRGALIKEKERLYREILRGIITDGNVSDARMLYYDTKVFLKGGYDEYLARTTPGGSGRVRPGQPDSSDTARSAQGAAVGAELSGDVRDGRDQATRAPAAEGVAPEIGINVASDIKAGAKYADLIVDGQKTLESRDTDSLRPYVGKRVAIVRTGEGQAKAIGAATIGEPILVDAKKFRELQNQHLVPEGSKFDIKGGNKYLYPIIDPERFGTEQEVGKGIVARRVRGKGTTSAAEDLAAVSPTAPAVSRVEKTKIKKAKGGEVSTMDFIRRAA
jgi:hypothetical protein